MFLQFYWTGGEAAVCDSITRIRVFANSQSLDRNYCYSADSANCQAAINRRDDPFESIWSSQKSKTKIRKLEADYRLYSIL